MKVIVMRGVPGSGKSTWVRKNIVTSALAPATSVVCSADDFHMVEGEYRFDPKNAPAAHDQCLSKFLLYLGYQETEERPKPNTLVVDNTNLSTWEVAVYYRLAQVYGEEVEIIRCQCPFETAWARNQDNHKVPDGVLWAMYQTLLNERLPAWWKETIVMTGEGRS